MIIILANMMIIIFNVKRAIHDSETGTGEGWRNALSRQRDGQEA
jgi:hypothetical protein